MDASLHGEPYAGADGIVLLKYSDDDSRLWTRMEGTTGYGGGYGVVVVSAGTVFVSVMPPRS